MIRMIRTEHLEYFHDSRNGGYGVVACLYGRPRIREVDNMPKGLPIELMAEWDEIAEIVFKEFIEAGRTDNARTDQETG